MAKLDDRGHEILDQRPAALPVGWKRPPSLTEQIRLMVRNELSARASEVGHESFEEADDFNVGDDFDPKSPWEMDFDQEMAGLEDEKPSMPEERLNGNPSEPSPKSVSPAPSAGERAPSGAQQDKSTLAT